MTMIRILANRVLWTAVATICLAAACAIGAFAQKGKNPTVVIETSEGAITVELFQDKAPKSVENFLEYAKSGFYKDTIFHRVIRGFMIQGGGFTADMQRKSTRSPITNEATNGISNARGTLAMARTNDVNSATSQFFINTVDNTGLNHRGKTPDAYGYAVFGKVTKGMDIVDKIESASTGPKGAYENVPLRPIVIKDVVVQ